MAKGERKNYGGFSMEELLEPLDYTVIEHARQANSGNITRLIGEVERKQNVLRSAIADLERTLQELNGWLETTGYMKADTRPLDAKSDAPGAHNAYR